MQLSTTHQSILSLLERHNIALEHSDACLAEAAAWLDRPGTDDPSLTDWCEQPFVTIDNEDSRDLDQALLIEKKASDYRVRYALADAAYYVPSGSKLFTEALQRGVTYYTPILAAPMLPTVLSEGLVSLNPDVKRRALVFDMLLDKNGEVKNTAVVRACIRSAAKLSYNGVQQLLDNTAEQKNQTYLPSLLLLKELGELLIQRALDRDVIPFKRHEASIKIADDGNISMLRRNRPRTEKYNEQISLLCNMQGALLLTRLAHTSDDLQAVYRVHEAPLSGRLKALRTLLDRFADETGLDAKWRWHKDQPLADYVMALPDNEETASVRAAIERQILVCNQASEYQSKPGRHHALAAESYARFSAPMREIVGIFTHKELLEVLTGNIEFDEAIAFQKYEQNAVADNKQIQAENSNQGHVEDMTAKETTERNGSGNNLGSPADDNALREQVIHIANESRTKQKRLTKDIELLALEQLLSQDLTVDTAPIRIGTIMGMRRERIYIACDDIACDLKVSGEDLARQHNTQYQFDDIKARAQNEAGPHWLLGERVGVITLGHNKARRRFELGLCKLDNL